MTHLRSDRVRTEVLTMTVEEAGTIKALWAGLEDEALNEVFQDLSGAAGVPTLVERVGELRYQGQEHTVRVPLPAGVIDADWIRQSSERFADAHDRLYHFNLQEPVELVTHHVIAWGQIDLPDWPQWTGGGPAQQAMTGIRPVWFEEGLLPTTIFRRERLAAGVTVEGPAIIEEESSTAIILPDQKAQIDEWENIVIEQE